MSTTPETMTVIAAAFEKLRSRILPAVLKQSNENGRVMGDYVRTQGHNIAMMTDPDLLASLMYEAVNRQAEKYDWQVKPKKLLLRQEDNKASFKDESNFAAKVKAAADAEAAKKASDKSRGITGGIISQMQLSTLGKSEQYKLKLHARVERLVKRGVAWPAIEKDIRAKISELSLAEERSQERVGQFRDLLAEVEV